MKTYVIIKVVDITDTMINVSTNSDTSYRISLNGELALLSFLTAHPDEMVGHVKYTEQEIKDFLIINKDQWSKNEI